MAILDTLDEAKAYLAGVKKKYRFRKARLAQKEAVELQSTLAQCRGKLEICKKDFNRAVNVQSKNIGEGMRVGADTVIQEQILWDSAIGYMLVRDAIFALETISSYDAVSHAYEMLDAAMKQVSGKKNNFPKSMKIGSTKERNAYGYLTSSASLREKEELLSGFFEELKVTGDIEKHLAAARIPAAKSGELRHVYTQDTVSTEGSSDIDAMMRRLSGVKDDASKNVDLSRYADSLLDIHVPKDNK